MACDEYLRNKNPKDLLNYLLKVGFKYIHTHVWFIIDTCIVYTYFLMAFIIFKDKNDNIILLYLVNKNVSVSSIVPYFKCLIFDCVCSLYSIGSWKG